MNTEILNDHAAIETENALKKIMLRLLSLRSTLGALEDDIFDIEMIVAIKMLNGDEGYQPPSTAAEIVVSLCDAIDELNNCYDDNGYLCVGAPEEHDALCSIGEAKERLFSILDID